LPRYLPDNIYILLTRRPFIAEHSGLLVETPHQFLDLSQFSRQNQEDIQAYLQLLNLDKKNTQTILNQSQFNFKYVTTTRSKIDYLPRLIDYYQSHWQQMKAKFSSELCLKVIDCWNGQNEWRSCEAIATQLDEDEYEIQLILENWIEFLEIQERESEIYYRWYHSHFYFFLKSLV
ncbi:MAG: ATP-binding protein, partial [Cyanobacteriota bacterium]|nr:ATP-binding protein [Cyanobacteriota bacterium]